MPAKICCTAADRSLSPPLVYRHVNTDTTPSRRPLLEDNRRHGRISLIPSSSPIQISTIRRQLTGSGTKAKQQSLSSSLQKRLSRESTKSQRSSNLKRRRSNGKPIPGAAATAYALLSSHDDILLETTYDRDATVLSSRLATLRSVSRKDEETESNAQPSCSSGPRAIPSRNAIKSRKTLKRISLLQLVDWDREDLVFEQATVNKPAAEEEPKSSQTNLNIKLSSSAPWPRKARSDSFLHASALHQAESITTTRLSSRSNVSSASPSLEADKDISDEEYGRAQGKDAPSRGQKAESAHSKHQATASGSSVHLHTMRISQHLRSTSTFSALEVFEAHNAHHSSDICGRQAPRSRQQRQASSSGFASAKVPVTWGKVIRDGASSHYSSRAGSPSILPFESSLNLPSSTEQLASKRVNVNTHYSESQDGSDAVESRQRRSTSHELSRPHIASSDNSSASTAGKSSKFTEEFACSPMHVKDPSIVKRRPFKFLALQTAGGVRKDVLALYDGPADNPATLETQPSIDPREQAKPDDAAALWEKALRAHRLEMLEPVRSRSTGLLSLGPRRPTSIRTRSRTKSLNSVLLQPPSMSASKQPSLASLNEEAYSDAIQRPMSVPVPKHTAVHARSTSSLQAWSRYPSHTRTERTGSAGLDDDVITRDFADLHISSRDWSDMSDGGSSKRKNKKNATKSMPFKKTFFKRWSRLYKSHSAHFPKLLHHTVAGHRSSLAVGGRLEYPELEIPPALSPFRMPENYVTETGRSRHDSAVAEHTLATKADNVVAGDLRASATEERSQSAEAPAFVPSRTAEARNVPIDPTLNSAAPAVLAQGDPAKNTKNGFLCPPQSVQGDGPTLYESCAEFPFPKLTDDDNPPHSHTPNSQTHDGTADSPNNIFLCPPQPLTRDASTIYESCVDLRFLRTTTEETIVSTPTTPDAMEAAQPSSPHQPRRLLGYRSLPATLRQPLVRYDSASAMEAPEVPLLRNSTNDLCQFLQQCEIAEREKLVRAAEGAWGSGG